MWCRTCFLFPEGQQHLLQCGPIVRRLENIIDFTQLDYNMIYGKMESQVKIAKSYLMILNTRLDLIQEMENS